MSQAPAAPTSDPASDRVLRLVWERMLRAVREAKEHGETITVLIEVAPGGRVKPTSRVVAPIYPARETAT